MKNLFRAIILIALVMVTASSCEKDESNKFLFGDNMHVFVTGEEFMSWESEGHYFLLFSPAADTLRIDRKVDSLIYRHDSLGEAREIHFTLNGDSLECHYYFCL